MKSFEHGLRTLPKTFAFFVKLTQNFEARFLLCLASFACSEFFLQACDKLLMLSQLLIASLKNGMMMIKVFVEFRGRFACGGDLLLDSRAPRFDVGDGAV